MRKKKLNEGNHTKCRVKAEEKKSPDNDWGSRVQTLAHVRLVFQKWRKKTRKKVEFDRERKAF